MNLKIVLTIMGMVWLIQTEIRAQIYSYPEEALAFTRIQPGGTARIRAMGGVQNSLGGDLSSAYYNPAGLGMFNRSEFSFTPGYSINTNTSDYLGTSTTSNKTTLMVPNFGVAFHSAKDGAGGLWGGTFAINFNRVADYNNTLTYKGTNPTNSIIDYFISAANGRDSSQFFSGPQGVNYNTPVGLAFYNYLIGPANELNSSYPKDQYFSYVPPQNIIQSETIKTTGSQNQWSFSYGVNFNDKIFIGGGLGLTTLSYKTTVTYGENYTTDPLINMQLVEDFEVSGSGVNLTLGIIGRPVDNLQLGLSMATPTSWTLNETYTANMSSRWNNFLYNPSIPRLNSISEHIDVLTNSYGLTTPWRFSGGVTYFIQKKGFFSADVEYLDYGASKFDGMEGSDTDNKDIKSLYNSVVNFRSGGEYRLSNYRFRVGYSLMMDPYKSVQNGVSRAIASYTGGVGYRTDKLSLDFAYVLQQSNATHSPYAMSPNVMIGNTVSSFIFTLGLPF